MKAFVSGIAGFIGFHVANRLQRYGAKIVSVDSINEYYGTELKEARLSVLRQSKMETSKPNHSAFVFKKSDVKNVNVIMELFEEYRPEYVCHLAAQAGVRYSLENPAAYIDSNISGFLNILEACRKYPVKHLVYASSSSVYGLNENYPFSTHRNVDHPVSLYAASKKANELMAHTYSHLYGIPTTGLRFFTVYGPWGRPDMALFKFTKAIIEGKPIDVYNFGNMRRDFTYIDDIVEGIIKVLDSPPKGDPQWSGTNPDPASARAPYKIYNIGASEPVPLMEFIEAIEEAVGKKAVKNMLPMQPGDVQATWADTTDMERDFGYKPKTSVREGVRRFVEWYRDYYKV